MNLKKQFARSFISVGALKLLGLPLGLATSIILARALSPEGFGQYAFIMALVPLIALPVCGGLPQLLTREVALQAQANNWSLYRGALRASHAWVIMVSLLMLATYWGGVVGFGLTPGEGKWSLLPVVMALVPLTGLAAVRSGVTKGLGFPAYAEIPGQIFQPVFVLLVLLALGWQERLTLKSALWAQMIAAAFVLLIATWMFYRIQPRAARNARASYQIGRWKRALLPFSMISLMGVLNIQVSIVVLGFLSTDEQVAAMRVAERAGLLVVMSLTLVNMVIAPYIVRAHREGNRAALEKLARSSARGSFFLSLPVALILVLGGEALIGWVFGADYSSISRWPVVLIAVAQLINVFFGSVGYLLSMSGYERDTLRGQALAVLANVVVCVVLAPKYGAVGAAWGSLISLLMWNLILSFLVKKRLAVKCSAL